MPVFSNLEEFNEKTYYGLDDFLTSLSHLKDENDRVEIMLLWLEKNKGAEVLKEEKNLEKLCEELPKLFDDKTSIGVEFINSSPFEKKFSEAQLIAGVELTKYLAAKYHIKAQNIVGHSDIAYNRDNQLLDRKQDPSHLFDWKFMAQNGVGIFPQISLVMEENIFELGSKNVQIAEIKRDLKRFGYRVINLNDEFDEEMRALVRVFNRRFLGKEWDIWCNSSQQILDQLIVKK